jgi:hypothetical protein
MRLDIVLVPRRLVGRIPSATATRERIASLLAERYPIERLDGWIVVHFPERASWDGALAQLVSDLSRIHRRWPLVLKIGLRDWSTRQAELRALWRAPD